ncbi:low molecular weight phosphotyrosine protein phosphatase [Vibrio parahaemolyticus]|uniref:low molecular weight protein-tyrosine-phosphatase n=1 Tax=Vibrio parahaemolyticus TaxID=670 RepID=UPI0011210616|nr:low molecular weight protein-tyrosine-phosphatase [Vibrio parahaemolyticus]EGQ8060482.1 low molecular weight phosphotyrosine protein phosphatase [Vibrio parahaemolyticus]EGR2202996.1 low molecular weight phosphotyrosine protein phosphatase [Vibrio parahaemolyticus]EHH1034849.1 low molecular weight phosphotyrosine protein phosphatase [Vibrio parahaemolyticus]EHH1248236.1 low molecular weight phosphotyrosine protein phosphatase [Vibrio parahaemolyticus]EHH2549876.1 low molecular weight phosph
MKRILVVCMGNICRSPTGEAVLRAKAEELGVDVDIDSAGTIGYHTGNTPDSRAMAAGKQRGYSFKGMRARQVSVQDFEDFDLVLAADKANLADLLDICPAEHRHKVSLFLSHSNSSYDEIPDPYYGGDDGFELVLDLIEEASVAALQKL